MVGPSNGAALQLDRALAGLARAGGGAERAGRLRQDPPRPYLGGRAPARRSSPPPTGSASEPLQLVAGSGSPSRTWRRSRFPKRRCSISSTGLQRRGRACFVTSRDPVADWHVRPSRPQVAAAHGHAGRACEPRRRAPATGSGQALRGPPARGGEGGDRLSSRADGTLARRGGCHRRDAGPRSARRRQRHHPPAGGANRLVRRPAKPRSSPNRNRLSSY